MTARSRSSSSLERRGGLNILLPGCFLSTRLYIRRTFNSYFSITSSVANGKNLYAIWCQLRPSRTFRSQTANRQRRRPVRVSGHLRLFRLAATCPARQHTLHFELLAL